jgi:dTDP-4-amino-4,6-dideoxygalactose transaminase
MSPRRIHLSPPHLEGDEAGALSAVVESGWIAPAGPELEAFEREFCAMTGNRNAVALSSCTSALHLALLLAGVKPGDDVLCSTFTFAASAMPVLYVGARPVFVDSEDTSWSLDPARLEEAIADRVRITGRPPRALILVHIYGQSADIDPIARICERHGIVLVEDAAEALGCIYRSPIRGEVAPGAVGRIGTYSFNGNKIITTSGGGMLTSSDPELVNRARFLSTQARDPGSHYQHSEMGYNYRMSNVLAALGRAQLRHLPSRVAARRAVFECYRSGLSDLPGIGFMPEAPWNHSTRWLTCITVDPQAFGVDREQVRLELAAGNIEARPVWKPLHLQPVFKGCPALGGGVSEAIFNCGLCLPSGSSLTSTDIERVIDVIRQVGKRA